MILFPLIHHLTQSYYYPKLSLSQHLEEKAVTPDHANLLLSEYFGRSEKKSILLVVDELDLLWTRKQHVMYNLFDWPNRPNSKLVVVAIANTMDLPERMLMNKVASRLGLTRMTFQPYSHHQLHGILTSRLEMVDGVFAPEACMLAARKVAAASGDARRALDICRHALDVAEREGCKQVGSIHIQKAITSMYQSVKTKAVTQATLYQKLFLKAVLGVFRRKGVEEAVYMEVYEVFTSLCQFQGLFAPPSLHVQALCGELGTARVLLVEEGPLTLHTHIRLNCTSMDLLASYGGSDSDGSDPEVAAPPLPPPVQPASLKNKVRLLNATPAVIEKDEIKPYDYISPDTKVLQYNPTVSQMYTPLVGPDNPYKTQQAKAQKNMFCGFVEKTGVSDFSFDAQRKTFQVRGYAEDPTAYAESAGKRFVGEVGKAEEMEGRTVFEKEKQKAKKRKKELVGDPSDPDGYKGPWAEYVDQVKVSGPSEEQRQTLEEWRAKKEPTSKDKTEDKERTILHIDDPLDYQGRSFMIAPKDNETNLYSDEPPAKCFMPKKLLHTYDAHNKGVAKITLFPKSGHMVLSCGMDSKIKLWEVYGGRRCIRTYAGHNKAVRDIVFNNDGSQFLSASYDRMIKLWDTETGECVSRFTTHKIPYCVQFNPEPSKQHLFISGMADKKIVGWDARSGSIVQEYDRHLGPVNTITFIERNISFVSTSDDKSIRVWDWDIPVDRKHIADPGMHSIPSCTISPTGKWLACQSMDNKITIFATQKLRLNRKKVFKGHMVAAHDAPTAMIGVPADVSTDEAKLIVRRLQLGAYYSLVNAFRASGYLTDKKLKILRELSLYFQLSTERHQAEIRRAVNDEELSALADLITKDDSSYEWLCEGRHAVPSSPDDTLFRLPRNVKLRILVRAIIALASAPGPKGGCGGAAPTLNGGVGAEPPP
eukprot:sb/3461781/